MQDAESQKTISVLFCTVIVFNSLSKKDTLIFLAAIRVHYRREVCRNIFELHNPLFFFNKGNDFMWKATYNNMISAYTAV